MLSLLRSGQINMQELVPASHAVKIGSTSQCTKTTPFTTLHFILATKKSRVNVIFTHTQKHTQNSRINILLLITNIYVYRYCACWFFLIATFDFSQAMLTFFLLQHSDMLLWLLTMKEKKCSSFKQPVHVSHVQGFNHFHPLEYYSPCWSSK